MYVLGQNQLNAPPHPDHPSVLPTLQKHCQFQHPQQHHKERLMMNQIAQQTHQHVFLIFHLDR